MLGETKGRAAHAMERRPPGRPAVTTTTTEALRPVTQLSEYIPVKHAAPKADCIDLYLVAYTQLHTPNRISIVCATVSFRNICFGGGGFIETSKPR